MSQAWEAQMPVDKIRVMISSRCKDYKGPDGKLFKLAKLRQDLKREIEATQLFGEPIFECFINEEEPAKSAALDLWDVCLKEARRAQIVIALYNGSAGWSKGPADVGICHAELMAGLQSGRERTRVIQLPLSSAKSTRRDERFAELLSQEALFSGAPVETEDQALALARQSLGQAVAALVRGGSAVLSKDSYALGEALAWSRLSFSGRKAAMEASCSAALLDRTAARPVVDRPTQVLLREEDAADLLICVHAIPAATSNAAAREMVGRPFLSDHLQLPSAEALPEAAGPVHLIACHRTATEKQATDLLGFPDATVVSTGFGVYVADPVQRIQLVLLANCRDDSSTRYAVQRFFDWLDRSGQRELLLQHAQARARIVRSIQAETASAP
ncbi:hypothetical protein WG899_11910 [Paucibacter sp. AS339]|uniref:hypothetical protein n=1 Tax=Paucibacter hankyongi TaxID=3133434 RepID=UPI0030A313C3